MPTKTSSEDTDRATAYGYLITNLLVLPGIGTVMSGQKSLGWMQILLSCIGMLLTIFGVAVWAVGLWQNKDLSQLWNKNLLIAIVGIVIFLVDWLWAGWTAYQLLRKVKND